MIRTCTEIILAAHSDLARKLEECFFLGLTVLNVFLSFLSILTVSSQTACGLALYNLLSVLLTKWKSANL